MIDDHPQAPNATRSEKVGRLPPKSAIPRLYLLGVLMDTYCMRVELTHTGPAPGWSSPVPLGWENLYDIPKKGMSKKTREEFHKLLDA